MNLINVVAYDIIIFPLIIYLFIFIFLYLNYKIFFNKFYIKINKKNNYILNIIKINNKNNYLFLYKFTINFLIYFFYLYFIFLIIFKNYSNFLIFNSFFFLNYSLIYIKIIILFSIFIFFLIKKNILNQKYYEIILGYTFFFFILLYYLIINNLLLIIFIFEIQSILFIYLISLNFFQKNNFKYDNLNITNYNLNYFNSLLYQYWISFIGTIMLIYSLLIFLKNFYFIDWINLEIFIYFYNNINFFLKINELKFIFLPLFFGLSLKIGLFPFFFWKPEIYKNLNIDLLLIYMTIYLFSLIFFFIFLLSDFIFLINILISDFFLKTTIIMLFLLPIIFYNINEIRTFLAYSSIISILLILSTIFLNSIFYSISFFYLFIYIFYILYIIIILYFFNNINIWNFSDLQYFYKNNFININLFTIFLGISGIPPFLGFFSKLSIISYLILKNKIFLSIIFFLISMIISFFFIQNYKYYGYNIKNINFLKNKFIYLINFKYLNIIIIFFFINIINFIIIGDIYLIMFIFKLY